jgi:hypothetical protein
MQPTARQKKNEHNHVKGTKQTDRCELKGGEAVPGGGGAEVVVCVLGLLERS